MPLEEAVWDLTRRRELELQQAVLLALRSQPRIILEIAEAFGGLDLGLDSSSPESSEWYSLAAGQVVDYDTLVGNHPSTVVEPIELEGAQLFQPELDIRASGTDTDTLDIDWEELWRGVWENVKEGDSSTKEEKEKEPATFSPEVVAIWEFIFGKESENENQNPGIGAAIPAAIIAGLSGLGLLGITGILWKTGLLGKMFSSRKSAETTAKIFAVVVTAIALCIPVVNAYIIAGAGFFIFAKILIWAKGMVKAGRL